MHHRALILVLLLMPLAHAHAAAPRSAITLDAASSEIDGRSNEVLLNKVVIRQQGYVIRADRARASGIDFDNSRWVFTGNVDITTPDGHSTANEATVNFLNNQLQSAQFVGQPVTFEQLNAQDSATAGKALLAAGRANTMVYDFNKNTVRLTGNAWIQYNQNEFRGNSVTYDIPLRKVLAKVEDQQGERVHITINPNEPAATP